MALTIGPRDDDELDELRAVFAEHRRRFDDGDWAVRYFERGIDERESTGADDGLPVGVGCPGLAARGASPGAWTGGEKCKAPAPADDGHLARSATCGSCGRVGQAWARRS